MEQAATTFAVLSEVGTGEQEGGIIGIAAFDVDGIADGVGDRAGILLDEESAGAGERLRVRRPGRGIVALGQGLEILAEAGQEIRRIAAGDADDEVRLGVVAWRRTA